MISQDVTTFHGGVDLETFLAELHYADTPEAAATIAAYLKGLERKRPGPTPKNRARRQNEFLIAKPARSNQRRLQ